MRPGAAGQGEFHCARVRVGFIEHKKRELSCKKSASARAAHTRTVKFFYDLSVKRLTVSTFAGSLCFVNFAAHDLAVKRLPVSPFEFH